VGLDAILLKLGLVLPGELETEYRNAQFDTMQRQLRPAIVVASIVGWSMYGVARCIPASYEIIKNTEILKFGILAQISFTYLYFALGPRGQLRQWLVVLTPLLPVAFLYAWWVLFASRADTPERLLQNQGLPLFILMLVYSLERISPLIGISSGILTSATFFYLREKMPLLQLVRPGSYQILLQHFMANFIGVYTCAIQVRNARIQYKLQRDLTLEKDISDSLIRRVFPKSIGQELRSKGSNLARTYQNVTVLIADIVNFTQITTTLEPKQLVNLLHQLFNRFDQLAEIHGVEKIKTIGDAYMAVAGCPESLKDHAQRTAYFALALSDLMNTFNRDYKTDFKIRIGINSGPVVGGVISGKRISFDLWGDTVNLASRLETSAETNEILVSESTAELLQEKFQLSTGRIVNIKGKGPTTVIKLLGSLENNPFLPNSTSKTEDQIRPNDLDLPFLSQH